MCYAAVAFHLSKVTGRDELLEDLHQLCYGSKGKVGTTSLLMQRVMHNSVLDNI